MHHAESTKKIESQERSEEQSQEQCQVGCRTGKNCTRCARFAPMISPMEVFQLG
jgi:hypothetical protein